MKIITLKIQTKIQKVVQSNILVFSYQIYMGGINQTPLYLTKQKLQVSVGYIWHQIILLIVRLGHLKEELCDIYHDAISLMKSVRQKEYLLQMINVTKDKKIVAKIEDIFATNT